MYQLGGEIQINNPDIGKAELIFNKDVLYLSHGRAAINLILKSIKISGSFLLPSYLCDSIIQPFVSNNIKIDFYEVDDHLNINIEDLSSRMKKGNIQGVYIINYFGFLFNYETSRVLQKIRREVLIIEDFSHGSLLETHGHKHIGHFLFSSFRKYLTLPDGCILINNSQIELRQDLIMGSFNKFFELKLTGKMLKSIYNKRMHTKEFENIYIKLLQSGEEILNTNEEIYSISNYSMNALRAIDFKAILSVRQENFVKLNSLFQDADKDIELLKVTLKRNISPFIFPIKVKKGIRDRLRLELVRKKLFCSILWPASEVVDIHQFPGTLELSNSILCLPIDQRYNIENMDDLFVRFMKTYKSINQ
jgi:dTDP-4-amino-4,6-dideoxygalactose transaminase